MNEAERPMAEETLHAYVDGRLDPALCAAVERYLQQNRAEAERVGAYSRQRDLLRTAFAGVVAEPIPPQLKLSRIVEERLARRRSPWRAAAGIVLALVIGGGGGWLVHSLAAPERYTGIAALEHEAANNHLVYAEDHHHPVELGPAQREELIRWVSSRLRHPVMLPELASLGYRFIGGRLVATKDGAAALFLYDDQRGERLSILVRPMRADRTTPIIILDIGDLDGCAWIENGVGYALIADRPYKELVRMSEFVRKQLGERT